MIALETVAASATFDDLTDAAGIEASHQSVYFVTGQSGVISTTVGSMIFT